MGYRGCLPTLEFKEFGSTFAADFNATPALAGMNCSISEFRGRASLDS